MKELRLSVPQAEKLGVTIVLPNYKCPEAEDNVKRIVACFEKFTGMETHEIEQLPTNIPTLLTRLSKRSRELDEVTEQRDALLHLLKEIKNSGDWFWGALEYYRSCAGEDMLVKIKKAIEESEK